METQIFDDGSTMTYSQDYGYVSATDANDSVQVSQSPNFPGGQTLLNAISGGFGRWVDYKTRPDPPANNVPLLSRPSETARAGGVGGLLGSEGLVLLLLVGGLIYALKD